MCVSCSQALMSCSKPSGSFGNCACCCCCCCSYHELQSCQHHVASVLENGKQKPYLLLSIAHEPPFKLRSLTVTHTLQGKGHEVKSKLRNDLKPTVIANWKLWVPAQFVNFRLVPPHLQVSKAHGPHEQQLQSHPDACSHGSLSS